MSLDIVIKVDPGSAVPNADRVTAALHRVENEGEKAGKAATGGLKQMGAAARATSGSFEGLARSVKAPLTQTSELAKQTAESTRILNERVREVGKTVAFNVAAQSFAALTKEIDGTAAAAANAAVQGAAVGATFGGPFGAAIGAAAGLVTGLTESLISNEAAAKKQRIEAEKQAAAYWDQVHALERKQRVENGLADVGRLAAESDRQLNESLQTQNRIINSNADATRRLFDELQGYRGKLTQAEEALRNGGGPREEAAVRTAERQVRDAQLRLDAIDKGYSESFVRAKQAENERTDRLEDLAQALGQQGLSQVSYNKLLAEYNALTKTAADGTDGLTDAQRRQREELNKLNQEIRRLNAETPHGARTTPLSEDILNPSVTGGKLQTAVHGVGSAAAMTPIPEIAKQSAASVDFLTDAWKRETEANEKASEEAQKLGDVFAPAVDTLVEGLRDGELSARKLEDALGDVAIQLLKMAAVQALKGDGGIGDFLAGALGGFATGGSGYVPSGPDPLFLPRAANGLSGRIGGAGGTDSKLFVARVTPGEYFEIRTPEQQAQRQVAQAGPVNVTVVAQNNERDVIAAGGTYGAKRVLVENMRQVGRRTR